MIMVVGLPVSPAIAVSVSITIPVSPAIGVSVSISVASTIPVSITLAHSTAVADSPGSESRRHEIQEAIRKEAEECAVAARAPAANSAQQSRDPQYKNHHGDRQDYSAPNAALTPVPVALLDPPHRTAAPKLP